MGIINPRTFGGRRKKRKSLVQALDLTERDMRMRETKAVVDQPHRMGDDSVLAESMLGAFIKWARESQDDRMATYAACLSYYRAWAALCSIDCIPTPVRLDESDHTGEEFTAEQIEQLRGRVEFCETELKRAGQPAFFSSKDLICYDIDVPEKRILPVKRVLISLTGMLGCFPIDRAPMRSTLNEEERARRRSISFSDFRPLEK